MTSRERYAVILKALGVYFVVTGFALLPVAMHKLHQYSDPESLFYMMMDSFAAPAVVFIAGYSLIFATNRLVQFTYPPASAKDDTTSNSSASPKCPSRALFKVVAKSIGLYDFIYAVASLPSVITLLHRYWYRDSVLPLLIGTAADPAIKLTLSYFLIFATDWVVRVAYTQPAAISSHEAKPTASAGSSSKELFLVISKAIGLWFAIEGITKLPAGIRFVSIATNKESFLYGSAEALALPLLLSICGCVLLFATQWIARIAYSDSRATDSDDLTEG